ncbi:hypothetical protein EDB87DRAFT_572777 [Lactarius vividus]|nr:hypothetical protein EDB87DRAFT_572777 [Lactarius vividus]
MAEPPLQLIRWKKAPNRVYSTRVLLFRRISDGKRSKAPMTPKRTCFIICPPVAGPPLTAPCRGEEYVGKINRTRGIQTHTTVASAQKPKRRCILALIEKSPTHSSSCSSFDIFTSNIMGLADTLGFCISVLGLVIYLRFLLPYNIIPTISSILTDAERSLALAITIGAVPEMSDYKVGLAVLARQLALIRIESHHSPGLFLQILLAVRRSYKLYSLASRIVSVRREVEVAMDLFLLGTPQTVVTPPSPVTADDTPADPTPPVPATVN